MAFKNSKNVRHFAEEQVKFKEFIAANWYFFKKITQDDIETRNKMMEVFLIENSFSYGFQKLAANSTDELVRYFYAVVFLVFLGYSFSDLFSSNVGVIASFGFGILSIPVYVYMKIRFRKWESYFTTRQAFKWYLKCTCCLQKKYKVKKQKDISEQLDKMRMDEQVKKEREDKANARLESERKRKAVAVNDYK